MALVRVKRYPFSSARPFHPPADQGLPLRQKYSASRRDLFFGLRPPHIGIAAIDISRYRTPVDASTYLVGPIHPGRQSFPKRKFQAF